MLHIFNQTLSSYKLNQLTIAPEDSILLLSDACYSALKYQAAFASCKVYALEIDLHARSVISTDPLIRISDEQWVELIIAHDTHITW